MSVIVMGMGMPTTCRECVIGNPKAKTCIIGKPKMNTKRRDDCPLIEIPTPHGRLIDADELANKTFYSVTSAPYITYKKFVDAPTVIEAEGETDGR